MKLTSRKLAARFFLCQNTLWRLAKKLPLDLLERNITLALQEPHYLPYYSLRQLGTIMGISKYRALRLVEKCDITVYWVGRKRIILFTDLDKLNQSGDYLKMSLLDKK